MAEPAARPASPPQRSPHRDQILLRTLMHAFYWVDDGLQAHMRREAN
jgi:hypothetical protein